MKKVILHIASSLDQRIAEHDVGLDWVTGFPNPKNRLWIQRLLASVDTVIMGATYYKLLNMDVIWLYKEQQTCETAGSCVSFLIDYRIKTQESRRARQSQLRST